MELYLHLEEGRLLGRPGLLIEAPELLSRLRYERKIGVAKLCWRFSERMGDCATKANIFKP